MTKALSTAISPIGPRPIDRDGVAGPDVCAARAEPGGGERVGHHQRLVAPNALGDLHGVDIRGGHAEGFGLAALQLRRQPVAGRRAGWRSRSHCPQGTTRQAPQPTAAGIITLSPTLSRLHAAPDLDHFADGFMADAKADIFGEASP